MAQFEEHGRHGHDARDDENDAESKVAHDFTSHGDHGARCGHAGSAMR